MTQSVILLWWIATTTCIEGFRMFYPPRACNGAGRWVGIGLASYFECVQVKKPSSKRHSTIFTVFEPSTTTVITTTTTTATTTIETTTSWPLTTPKSIVAVLSTRSTETQSETIGLIKDGNLGKEDERHHLMVNITVPTVVMFCIVLLLIIISIIIIRRRKLSDNGSKSHPSTVPLGICVGQLDVSERESTSPGFVQGDGAEYEDVVHPDISPINTGDKEYDALHINTHNSSNTEPFSIAGETQNEYNRLTFNNTCTNISMNESVQDDPHYDRTEERSGMLSRMAFNTYDHVSNNLCESATE